MTRTRTRPAALATTARISSQLRGDPRAVGLILVVPPLLLLLLHQVFVDVPVPPGGATPFQTIGPIMLAVIPMFLMFVITSVTMLRERVSGTLERILTTPLHRWNLVASYALVFGTLAVLQAGILVAVLLGPLEVRIEGPVWAFLVLALLSGIIGVSFGLLASAFARTEFQAVQFMPVFITPQVFLCGLLVPREQMPELLDAIAGWLPMTWAVDVVRELLDEPTLDTGSWVRLAGLAAAALVALGLAAASMPRRTR